MINYANIIRINRFIDRFHFSFVFSEFWSQAELKLAHIIVKKKQIKKSRQQRLHTETKHMYLHTYTSKPQYKRIKKHPTRYLILCEQFNWTKEQQKDEQKENKNNILNFSYIVEMNKFTQSKWNGKRKMWTIWKTVQDVCR